MYISLLTMQYSDLPVLQCFQPVMYSAGPTYLQFTAVPSLPYVWPVNNHFLSGDYQQGTTQASQGPCFGDVSVWLPDLSFSTTKPSFDAEPSTPSFNAKAVQPSFPTETTPSSVTTKPAIPSFTPGTTPHSFTPELTTAKSTTKFTKAMKQKELSDKQSKVSPGMNRKSSCHVLKTPLGERYQCTVCLQTFSTHRSYNLHAKKCSSSTRVYRCEFCEKLFNSNNVLRVHRRIHTGHRPHKCAYCPQSFADNSSKDKHQRTHTKEKPYKCELCHIRFTQSGNLARHIRNQHMSTYNSRN